MPAPRGPLTASLFELWLGHPPNGALPPLPSLAVDDPLSDDDLQLALYCCWELSYRGFAGVHPGWEESTTTFELRRDLGGQIEGALRELTAAAGTDPLRYLDELTSGGDGPSLSAHLLAAERLDWFLEFLAHRAPYQSKEADPHSWGLPRLAGLPKAAMVEIQSDEYGEGRPGQAHADLFAATLRSAGLDDAYGAWVDHVPAVTLATTNLISHLGSARRLVPALAGHLALFEMTSVGPMGRYAELCDRLALGPEARRFFDVHVQADDHHGPLARNHLVGGLLAQDPGCGAEIVFGAAALDLVERRLAEHLRTAWDRGRSSLRIPLGAPHRHGSGHPEVAGAARATTLDPGAAVAGSA
ncbi:iron-containing redox enzyme family protein [Rhabdothermincola salaria]|uniref:iron-containing redox enzyme family protein n=1 Tax=Rhabdothermincola salaria TaxID=2903142 RepID=UPI001E5AA2FC|nr:iron-containing redox enzyme family protein [Rhabdothermincola salaria]MCD9624510.1 iron-containing redox enzyme family protein [Rhabdothermincola salaria]